MSSDQLMASFLKIKRANEHIDEIKASLKLFGQHNPQKMRSQYDTERKRLSVVFADCKPIPPGISILIGEVLYQQRSALDFLVWQLIKHATGANPKIKCNFPIFLTREGYETRGKRVIQGVSPSAADRICNIQPFHKGPAAESDGLWMLHDLNNTDKHRALIVAGSAMVTGPNHVKLSPPVELEAFAAQWWAIQTPVENGSVLVWFETTQRKVAASGQVPITIVFNEAGPAKDQPVVPLLTQLSGYISTIIDSFSVEFI